MEEPTPRAQVMQWVRQQVAGQSVVKLPDLTLAAVEHFAKDRAFVKSFLKQALYTWVYEAARAAMHQTRVSACAVVPHGTIAAAPTTVPAAPILLGAELVTREEFQERARAKRSRWEAFMERAGERHILLTEMTRVDLALAIEARHKQVDTSLGYIRLYEALRTRLQDGETVGQRFTPDEIERLHRQVNGTDTEERAA